MFHWFFSKGRKLRKCSTYLGFKQGVLHIINTPTLHFISSYILLALAPVLVIVLDIAIFLALAPVLVLVLDIAIFLAIALLSLALALYIPRSSSKYLSNFIGSFYSSNYLFLLSLAIAIIALGLAIGLSLALPLALKSIVSS